MTVCFRCNRRTPPHGRMRRRPSCSPAKVTRQQTHGIEQVAFHFIQQNGTAPILRVPRYTVYQHGLLPVLPNRVQAALILSHQLLQRFFHFWSPPSASLHLPPSSVRLLPPVPLDISFPGAPLSGPEAMARPIVPPGTVLQRTKPAQPIFCFLFHILPPIISHDYIIIINVRYQHLK